MLVPVEYWGEVACEIGFCVSTVTLRVALQALVPPSSSLASTRQQYVPSARSELGVKPDELRPETSISFVPLKSQLPRLSWIAYVMVSLAPAGSLESVQSKVVVASFVFALSAGDSRFAVVGATLLTCTECGLAASR